MKTSWHRRLLLGIGILVLLALVRVRWFGPEARARAGAEAARAELRAQGFKIGLGEFELPTSAEGRRRGDAVRAAAIVLERAPELRVLDLMSAVAPGAARAEWRRDRLPTHQEEDHWPAAMGALRQQQQRFDSLAAAFGEGPVEFEARDSDGTFDSSHLWPLKVTARTLAGATATALHAGDTGAAWTNLLALTDLLAHWRPEPTAVAQLVRVQVLQLAVAATWEALQTHAWTDRQLSLLQERWTGLDLLSPLPEVAAFARAESFAMYEEMRNEAVVPLTQRMGELLELVVQQWASPSVVLHWFRETFAAWGAQVRYRNRVSYEEERAMALASRDLETRLREAVRAPSGPVLLRCAAFEVSIGNAGSNDGNPARPPHGIAGGDEAHEIRLGTVLRRAAFSEAWRRIVVVALAVERSKLRRGAWPHGLDEIPGECLPFPATDFFDDAPLRYQCGADGFQLASVGADLEDHRWSDLIRPIRRLTPERNLSPLWPRPATPAELQAFDDAHRFSSTRRRVHPGGFVLSPEAMWRFGLTPAPPPLPTPPAPAEPATVEERPAEAASPP